MFIYTIYKADKWAENTYQYVKINFEHIWFPSGKSEMAYKWVKNFLIFRFLQKRFHVIYGAKIKMMHFLIFLSRFGFSWRESNMFKIEFYILVGIFSPFISFIYGVNKHIFRGSFFYSLCINKYCSNMKIYSLINQICCTCELFLLMKEQVETSMIHVWKIISSHHFEYLESKIFSPKSSSCCLKCSTSNLIAGFFFSFFTWYRWRLFLEIESVSTVS